MKSSFLLVKFLILAFDIGKISQHIYMFVAFPDRCFVQGLVSFCPSGRRPLQDREPAMQNGAGPDVCVTPWCYWIGLSENLQGLPVYLYLMGQPMGLPRNVPS